MVLIGVHVGAGDGGGQTAEDIAVFQTGVGVAADGLGSTVIGVVFAVGSDGDDGLGCVLGHVGDVAGDGGSHGGGPAGEVVAFVSIHGGTVGSFGGGGVHLQAFVGDLGLIVAVAVHQNAVGTLFIGDGVHGDDALQAGNGELIALVLGPVQLRHAVGGMPCVLVKAFHGGVQLHLIGQGVGVDGVVAVLHALGILQLPGQVGLGAVIGDVGGQRDDGHVLAHGVGDLLALNTGGDVLRDGLEGSHQFGGVVGIVGAAGLGHAVTQEVAHGGAVSLATAAFVGQLIGYAEADGVQVGVAAQSSGSGCGGAVDLGAAALAVAGVTAIAGAAIGGGSVGQGDDALAGDVGNGSLVHLGVGVIEAVVQVGAAALRQSVDLADSGVVTVLAGAAGHVDPILHHVAVGVEVNDGQPAGSVGVGAGIGDQEALGGVLGGLHAGLSGGRIGVVVLAVVGAAAGMSFPAIRVCTALSAEAHRAGGVDDQHNGGCVGLHLGLGPGLDRQGDLELVLADHLSGLAQIQGGVVVGGVLNRAGAALSPFTELVVRAIGHVGFLIGILRSPCGRRGEAEKHHQCHKQGQDSLLQGDFLLCEYAAVPRKGASCPARGFRAASFTGLTALFVRWERNAPPPLSTIAARLVPAGPGGNIIK